MPCWSVLLAVAPHSPHPGWVGEPCEWLGCRYTAWVPGPDYEANWNSTGVMMELYVHTNDTGADFDAMDEPANLAYNNAHEKARATLHAIAYSFFHDYLPPVGPSPPGPSPPPRPPGQAAAGNSVCVILFWI